MTFAKGLSGMPEPFLDIARMTDEAGGAVVAFDSLDHITHANSEQRRIMPCSSYGRDETYRSLFWSALNGGMTGNPVAKQAPAEWLEDAVAARRCSPNLDFINSYSWGKMLVSHLRLDDGISIQLRLNMRETGLERYFSSGNELCLGVTRAIRLRKEIRQLQAALDSLGLAVAITDGHGSLLHANASFADLLDVSDGLEDPLRNGLRATDSYDNLVLQQALENVAAGVLPVAYVPIRRRKGDPLIISVSAGSIVGTTIIAAPRFGEDVGELNRALQQALGVSVAEADMMVGLARGETTEQLTERRNITKGTAYRLVDDSKRKLERSQFVAPDKSRIASLVTGLAAIIRAPSGRKH